MHVWKKLASFYQQPHGLTMYPILEIGKNVSNTDSQKKAISYPQLIMTSIISEPKSILLQEVTDQNIRVFVAVALTLVLQAKFLFLTHWNKSGMLVNASLGGSILSCSCRILISKFTSKIMQTCLPLGPACSKWSFNWTQCWSFDEPFAIWLRSTISSLAASV